MYLIISLLFAFISSIRCENVLMTEVFEIEIDPPMFNWTYEGMLCNKLTKEVKKIKEKT